MPDTLRQGDPRLLDSDLAQRRLASTELAHLGYVTHDGTPPVLPMLLHSTGDEIVFSTFAGAVTLDCMTRFPGGGTAAQFAQQGR